jgi:EthD domain
MRGLLFSQMEPPPGWEADFHDWYETEHIPARMAVPGFDSAVRYEALDGEPRYLACYFLADMGALATPAYARLKREPGERTARMLRNVRGFTRYLCDETFDSGDTGEESSALYTVAFSVPGEQRAEFDGWYEDEHIPLLLRVPGWLRVRRYVVRPGGDGPPWTHLALHELRDAAALDRPERAAARDTPRRAALATRPWFRASGRRLYRPIHRAVAAAART